MAINESTVIAPFAAWDTNAGAWDPASKTFYLIIPTVITANLSQQILDLKRL